MYDAGLRGRRERDDSTLSEHQRAWSRARLAGWAVFAAVCAIAVTRVLTVSSEQPPKRLSETERVAVGRAAAAEEPTWRLDSLRSFPDQHWSQDDDFANTERRWVRDEAARRQVPQTDVFRAIDEDLKRHPPEQPRKATSAASKPRPAYD